MAPPPRIPLSDDESVAVTVCSSPSLFAQVTVAPVPTVSEDGSEAAVNDRDVAAGGGRRWRISRIGRRRHLGGDSDGAVISRVVLIAIVDVGVDAFDGKVCDRMGWCVGPGLTLVKV